MNSKRLNRILISAGFLLIGALVGFIIASDLGIITESTAKTVAAESVDNQTDNQVVPDDSVGARHDQIFINASKKVTRSVVNISTTRIVNTGGGNRQLNPLLQDPFFRRFFGDQFYNNHQKDQRERKEQSLGSGVIVSADGYIITNHHVIDKADEIKVFLSDKREFTATLVGSDKKIDIAVLKIEAEDLPVIQWGNSEKLQIGEYVLAVGNPFGLNQTVTMGIVSAVGRSNVGINDYENFIQTDAAINPGNSGGALVNIDGELVGINSAIYTRSGGYMGIGFAVPSNMVKNSMDSLIKYGKVIRGWLGVSIQTITKELAAQFRLADRSGALVSEIIKGSPADRGGIKRGDVIVGLDDFTVKDITQLRNKVASISVGTNVTVKVIRKGEIVAIPITIGDLSDSEHAEVLSAAKEEQFDNVLSGIAVENLTDETRRKLQLDANESGVMITHINPNSDAGSSGLVPTDIIQEINRYPVANMDEFNKVAADVKKGETILMLIKRRNRNLFITISSK